MCGGGIASVGGGGGVWHDLDLAGTWGRIRSIRYARRRALLRPPARQRSGGHYYLNPSSTRSTASGIATGRWSARVT